MNFYLNYQFKVYVRKPLTPIIPFGSGLTSTEKA